MLRRDACCPADQQDVTNISMSLDPEIQSQKRTIHMLKYHSNKNNFHVTDKRWESFGWSMGATKDPVKVYR
jgi:hypothetical protein